jgi:hypothetical protein
VSGCRTDQKQKPLDACQNNCTPAICDDPSKIKFTQMIDQFRFHGRLTTDATTATIDFASQPLVIELRTPGGRVLYRASLPAGNMIGDPLRGNFKFRNSDAKTAGGIAKVKIAFKTSRGSSSYNMTVMAYGNLYNARAGMTTHVRTPNEQWTVEGVWEERRGGWRFKP